MEPKHLINIAGTTCPPETDEVFNKWYDEEHIPVNMTFKGLDAVTRYKLIGYAGDGTVKEYPGYLAVYRFKDFDTFKAWNGSPELVEARRGYGEIAKGGVELLWRVQYGSTGSWKKTPPMSVINVVGLHCPPEGQARFGQWYSEKYIPDILKFKGMLGATRYDYVNSGDLGTKTTRPIKVKEYPRFLTFYYYEDQPTAEAFDTSPERYAAREDWLNVSKQTGTSVMWRARYRPLRTWQR